MMRFESGRHVPRRLPLATTLAAVLALPAPAALAATDEALLFQAIPSVFSASKYEQKVSEAPSSVSIVTAEEIRKLGHRTLADVLRGVRGFYVTTDRNYSYIGTRGFGRPGDYNTRVLVMINGHRVNDNVYSGIYPGYEFPLDIDLVDRIEVVRGPGSSIHGTGAFFGVVNVITRRGRDLQGVELAGEAASDATRKGRASWGGRFAGGVEALVSATSHRSDGQRELYFPEFDSPATNAGVATGLDGERAKNLFGMLSWGGWSLQGAYVSRDKQIPTAPYGTVFNDPAARTRDTQQFVEAAYVHEIGTDTTARARAHFNRYDYAGRYPYDYPPPTLNRDGARGMWWGGELQLTTRIARAHKLTAGGEFASNRRQEQVNEDVDPFQVYLDSQRTSRTAALYVQDEYALTETVLLTAGLRHDRISQVGGSTNPRLSMVWNPGARTSVKLLYGTAFRAPNVYEMFYSDLATQKPNPDLKPERIRTTEAVLEHYLDDSVRGTVSVYRYAIDRLISLQADPDDGLLVFRNVERVDSRGLELELDGKWRNGVEGRASWTTGRTVNAGTGQLLSNSPRHLAKLGLTVPLAGDSLHGGVEVQSMSRRTTPKDGTVGGTTLVNLALARRNLRRGLDVSASVHNVFDRRYADPASLEHVQDALPQFGRSLRVKMRVAF